MVRQCHQESGSISVNTIVSSGTRINYYDSRLILFSEYEATLGNLQSLISLSLNIFPPAVKSSKMSLPFESSVLYFLSIVTDLYKVCWKLAHLVILVIFQWFVRVTGENGSTCWNEPLYSSQESTERWNWESMNQDSLLMPGLGNTANNLQFDKNYTILPWKSIIVLVVCWVLLSNLLQFFTSCL